MSWSEERVEILKKMWLDGKSASEIAKELGEITRNAVIGKVHRLGLSNRETKSFKQDSDPAEKKSGQKRGRPRKNQTTAEGKKPLKEARRAHEMLEARNTTASTILLP